MEANVKLWGLAVTLLSASLGYAAEGSPLASATLPPLIVDPTGMELVLVKGGCYQMGDIYNNFSHDGEDGPDQKPVHEVCVNDLYVGRYEVTRRQWRSIMGTDPSSEATCGRDDCPVDKVAFSDVKDFIKRLNAKDGGSRYRLPTEAEWEYAARSRGKNERYAGGNDVDSVSWYAGTTRNRVRPSAVTRPVGTKAPNGLGIYDMSGNVYEITSDLYDATYYSSSPRDNPTGPSAGEYPVKRGGCATGNAGNSRVARRRIFFASGPSPVTGFRLVRIP